MSLRGRRDCMWMKIRGKMKSIETGFEGLLEFQQMDTEKNDFIVVMEGNTELGK